MIDTLFKFCCGVMEVMAVLTGYTYKDINTICFIYLQPAILTFTAALPMLLMIYKLWKQRTPKRFAITAGTVVWFLPFAFGTLKLWNHYEGSMTEAFDKAVLDLHWLGNATGLGYEMVNILLFIVAFLFFFLLNIFLFTFLRNIVLDAPKVRRHKKTKK